MSLSLQDFLYSKQLLIEATRDDPIVPVSYTVRKYCKIPLGETKQTKQYISIKPKDIIVLEWSCENIDYPVPVKCTINEQQYPVFYTHEQMKMWLDTNTSCNKQDWIY